MGGQLRLGGSAPLPVNQQGIKLRTIKVRLAPPRRPVTHAVLRVPVVVNAPVAPAFVARPVVVRLAAPIPRRKITPTWVFPIVVFGQQQMLGGIMIQLAYTRPVPVRSRLYPPRVVNP